MNAIRARARWLLVLMLGSLPLLLVTVREGEAGPLVPCGDSSAPECLGMCPAAQGCIAFSRGGSSLCACRNIGCCRTSPSSCTDDVPALTCAFLNGAWGRGESCASGCQPTMGEPNGGSCTDATDCTSDNCVGGVCCDTICVEPNQSCNLPGYVGVCSEIPAPLPTASSRGLVLIVATLLVIGGSALLRRRIAARERLSGRPHI